MIKPNFEKIFSKPDFISHEEALTGAEKGTAYHIAMQYIDFNKCDTEGNTAGELERLMTRGILDERQRESINIKKIFRFFNSGIGKRILSADKLYREFKISLLVPAGILYDGCGNDEMLLQGVVDCCIEENNELTIIDYKTDYVNDDNLFEKHNLDL